MSRCSILLKQKKKKINVLIIILNCRKNLELEHGFIFVDYQIIFNEERSNYSIVNNACLYVDFLKILCMPFINLVWIFIAPIPAIMSINVFTKFECHFMQKNNF